MPLRLINSVEIGIFQILVFCIKAYDLKIFTTFLKFKREIAGSLQAIVTRGPPQGKLPRPESERIVGKNGVIFQRSIK